MSPTDKALCKTKGLKARWMEADEYSYVRAAPQFDLFANVVTWGVSSCTKTSIYSFNFQLPQYS